MNFRRRGFVESESESEYPTLFCKFSDFAFSLIRLVFSLDRLRRSPFAFFYSFASRSLRNGKVEFFWAVNKGGRREGGERKQITKFEPENEGMEASITRFLNKI